MTLTVHRVNRPHSAFTQISNEFLRAAMPTAAFRVGCYVLSHTSAFEMTSERIGKAVGMSRNTVDKALRDLEDLDYMIRVEQRNTSGHKLGSKLIMSDIGFTPEERAEALSVEIVHREGGLSAEIEHKAGQGTETLCPKSLSRESLSRDFGQHKNTNSLEDQSLKKSNALAVVDTAKTLVQEALPHGYPRKVQTDLSSKVGALLDEGVDPIDISGALRIWLARPDSGPGLLPYLVGDAIKQRHAHTQPKPLGKPTQKAMGWKDAGEEAARLLGLPPENNTQTTTLHSIEGTAA